MKIMFWIYFFFIQTLLTGSTIKHKLFLTKKNKNIQMMKMRSNTEGFSSRLELVWDHFAFKRHSNILETLMVSQVVNVLKLK